MSGIEIAAVVIWTLAAYRSRTFLREHRDRTVRSYWLGLIFLGIAFTFTLPDIYHDVDSVLRYPNLSRLVINGSAVIGVGCAEYGAVFTLLDGRSEIIWRRLIVAATVLTPIMMAGFFLSAHPAIDTVDFYHYYGMPAITAYRLIYLAYIGASMMLLGALWGHRVLVESHLGVRTGFSLMFLGAATAMVYVLQDLGLVLREAGFTPVSWWGSPAGEGRFIALSVLLVLVGVSAGAWIRLATLLRSHVARMRTAALRYELRSAGVMHGLVDEHLARWRMLDMRDAKMRLGFEIAEMHDAVVWLPRYVPARVVAEASRVARARSLSPVDASALIDAAKLRFGAQAYAAGARQTRELQEVAYGSGIFRPGGFWSEVRYFERVSKQLREIDKMGSKTAANSFLRLFRSRDRVARKPAP